MFDFCGDEQGERVLICMPGKKEIAERDNITENK